MSDKTTDQRIAAIESALSQLLTELRAFALDHDESLLNAINFIDNKLRASLSPPPAPDGSASPTLEPAVDWAALMHLAAQKCAVGLPAGTYRVEDGKLVKVDVEPAPAQPEPVGERCDAEMMAASDAIEQRMAAALAPEPSGDGALIALLQKAANLATEDAKAYAAVCNEIGIQYEPCTGPTAPGPLEAVLAHLRELKAAQDREIERAMLLDEATGGKVVRGTVRHPSGGNVATGWVYCDETMPDGAVVEVRVVGERKDG